MLAEIVRLIVHLPIVLTISVNRVFNEFTPCYALFFLEVEVVYTEALKLTQIN